MDKGMCLEEDCSRQVSCRGWCRLHYQRWRKHGTTEVPVCNRPLKTTLEVLRKLGEDSCWHWPGSLDRDGYGKVNVDHRTVVAHRWTYEMMVGPIPKGMYLDHLCRVRRCVNPAHLEPVTPRENTMRGIAAVRQMQWAVELLEQEAA